MSALGVTAASIQKEYDAAIARGDLSAAKAEADAKTVAGLKARAAEISANRQADADCVARRAAGLQVLVRLELSDIPATIAVADRMTASFQALQRDRAELERRCDQNRRDAYQACLDLSDNVRAAEHIASLHVYVEEIVHIANTRYGLADNSILPEYRTLSFSDFVRARLEKILANAKRIAQ